jgi:iron(III) transport system substrate-binding protein
VKRIIPWAVMVLFSASALAACGGDDGGEDGGGKTSIADIMAVSSHDELVDLANKEGKLVVSTSFTEDSIPAVEKGFEKLYPDIDLQITEQTGDDDKRILLEIQAGQSEQDVMHLSAESYEDYVPYFQDDIDLSSLIEKGVLDIAPEMVNPDHKSTLAVGSGIGAFAYNPSTYTEDQVPSTWDDFLKPEFKDKKFMVDIEPANLACLGVIWGEDKLLEYAKAIKDQNPIWVRGDTNSLTLMAAGEYDLHAFSNYHSAFRVSRESDNIAIKIIEPVPVRITQIEGTRKGAAHPAAALLFQEYTAGPEVQQILDEDEPRQSSIYAPGSELNKLTEGMEVSVMDWTHFSDQAKWEAAIFDTWGFPSAEVKEED